MTDFGGDGLGVPLSQLGVGTDAGQWGAQLMAGVSHEAAQAGLTGLALVERRLYVPEHLVEGCAELTDLGARIGLGHPVGEVDGAAAQRQPADFHGCGGDAVQRAQREPDPAGSCQPGQQQGCGEDDQLGDHEPLDRRLDVAHRQSGDVDVTVLASSGHQAVVGERGQLGGRRWTARCQVEEH
jgi:hypothetical protein